METDKGQRKSEVPQVEYDPPEITDEVMTEKHDEWVNRKYVPVQLTEEEKAETVERNFPTKGITRSEPQ